MDNEIKRLNYFEEFISNECIRKDLEELDMINNPKKKTEKTEKTNKTN